MATGRTVGKYCKVQVDDLTALRDIPVMTIAGVGINYDEVDVSAIQEAVKGVLAGQGNSSITITGPFDNTAVGTASGTGEAAVLSGSHTVLSALAGGNTPFTFAVYFGIRGFWATGDPVFGGANMWICSDYTVDDAAGTYSAKISHAGVSTMPAWGTAVIAA